jgi:hypothetical protein
MKSFTYYLFLFLFSVFMYSCTKSEVSQSQNNNNNNTNNSYRLNISGLVKKCNNQALTNGDLVIATNRGYELMHITNGHFDTTLTSAERFDSLIVWVINMDSLTVSDTLRMSVSADSINLGTLIACSQRVDEFIKCKIAQDEFVYVPMLFDTISAGGWDTLGAPTTYFYRSSMHISNSTFYRMQFPGMSQGIFNVNWNAGFHMGRYYSFNMPTDGTATYNTYQNVGGYIEGTLHIPFVDNTDSLHYLLTGNFRVKRNY